MYYAGISSNIMSLAGHRHRDRRPGRCRHRRHRERLSLHRAARGRSARPSAACWETVLESTRLVGRPVFFSMAIILLAFIPVFALTGQEGKLFHPLAFTKTFAVLAATVIAVTLVPVLCTLLLGGRLHGEDANPVMRGLRRLYRPVLERGARHRRATHRGAAAAAVRGRAVAGARDRQRVHAAAERGRPDVHADRRSEHLARGEHRRSPRRQNATLQSFPEVAYVVAKVARADTSTDPAPLNMTETIVHLKPRDQWRPGMTLDRLRAEMSRAVQLPGVSTIWTMPIINRIDMLTTGIRSEVGVKIFGADLTTLEDLARQVADVVRTRPRRQQRLSRAGDQRPVPEHRRSIAPPRPATASVSATSSRSSRRRSARRR